MRTTIEEKEGETMGEITTVGLDLAKRVFHLIGCNEHGKEVRRKMLKRGQVLAYFANLPPCLIGMEACGSSHYWARRFKELGHEVRLIPPQHVKAYVRGNKNDYNDARAGHTLCGGQDRGAAGRAGAASAARSAGGGTNGPV